MTSNYVLSVVNKNKYRFYDYYYEELDKFILQYEDENIIKTIKEDIEMYYQSDGECVGSIDINITKEPTAKSKKLVKQVFDASSRCEFESMELLVHHLDMNLKFILYITKTNTDIFELCNINSITNIFKIIEKCKIVLYYNFNKYNIIKTLLDVLIESKMKLKIAFLDVLLTICYNDITYIRQTEYNNIISNNMSSSHSSHSSHSSNINYSNGNYIHNKDIPSTYGSPLVNIIQFPIHIESPPIDSIKVLPLACYEYYISIIKYIYTMYSKCEFWLSYNIYNISLHLLEYRLEFDNKTIDLINDTLNYFTKASLLYNPSLGDWDINIYIRNNLHELKKLILYPRPTTYNNVYHSNNRSYNSLHWIFRLMNNNIIKSRTEPMYNEGRNINKGQLLIVDGRNWFYSKDNPHSNYINIKELNIFKTEYEFIGYIYDKLKLHFSTIFKVNITATNFMHGCRCVFVFNDYHHKIISKYCPHIINYCIFTPQSVNMDNDDIFCLYLWLSNPGSIILSNDMYRVYADKLAGNHYYQGLWNHWINSFQIRRS
jgi:hypothetical protein